MKKLLSEQFKLLAGQQKASAAQGIKSDSRVEIIQKPNHLKAALSEQKRIKYNQ